MSRRSKGPHLWLRPSRRNAKGKLTHISAWFVIDGTRQHSTGLGSGATADEKEEALVKYLAEKHGSAATSGKRDPSQIIIDDVLALYVLDIVAKHARPEETKARIEFLRSFWGGRMLDAVTGAHCREYAGQRSTMSAARRELEDLRAAINHHRREGLHDKIVSVVLPEKPLARERWLTRSEAASLVWSGWRYREMQNHRATDRHTRRHIARFMVVARYMGSRASIICGASLESRRPAGKPWVDLTNGVFYGRAAGVRETNKRRQRVRIPPPLLAHMRRWRARGQKHVVEWNGDPILRVSKAHNSVVKSAGLGKDVTPHVWRHTAITWALQGGAKIWDVAKFFGLTVETVERVYGHHALDDSVEVHGAFTAHRTAANRQWNANNK